ncbi:unnamed protein product, partial [Heterotrigona itama]
CTAGRGEGKQIKGEADRNDWFTLTDVPLNFCVSDAGTSIIFSGLVREERVAGHGISMRNEELNLQKPKKPHLP